MVAMSSIVIDISLSLERRGHHSSIDSAAPSPSLADKCPYLGERQPLHTGNGTGSAHVCVLLLVGHDDGKRLTITSVDALLLHVGLSLLHLVCLPQSSSIAAGDGDHQR
mgnify:CR=1 FL=1